jgi:hypothetical protein
VFDAWNRLVEVKNTTGGAPVAKYEYDALNRRTVKFVAAGPQYTHLYYAGNSLLETRVGSSSTIPTSYDQQYILGGTTGGRLMYDRDLGGSSSSSSSSGGGTPSRLYLATDMTGNVTSLANTLGDVVERYICNAPGALVVLNSAGNPIGSNQSQFNNICIYRLWFLDVETGLFSNSDIYYHAYLGLAVATLLFGIHDILEEREREERRYDSHYLRRQGPKWWLFVTEKDCEEYYKQRLSILACAKEFGPSTNPKYPGTQHTSVRGLIDGVRSQIAKARNTSPACVEFLEIRGHGTPKGMRIGDVPPPGSGAYDDGSSSDKANYVSNTNASAIGKLFGSQIPFCCKCTIRLSSCNTGNLKGDSPWPQKLADGTGCTVIAPMGYQYGTVLENGPSPKIATSCVSAGEAHAPLDETSERCASQADKVRTYKPRSKVKCCDRLRINRDRIPPPKQTGR